MVDAMVSEAIGATLTSSSLAQCTKLFEYVPVAQLDRVQPSEGWGQEFESPRARHNRIHALIQSEIYEKNERCSEMGIFFLLVDHYFLNTSYLLNCYLFIAHTLHL